MTSEAAGHPRVLFVTPHAFNKVTGGGITFTNLFQGWPRDAIATVHNDPEPTTDEVCERYFVLGRDEIDLVFPFDRLRRGFSGPSGGCGGERHDDDAAPGGTARPPMKGRMLGGLKRLMLATLGETLPEKARLTPVLERWIADYRPEVLYTILGSNGMMELIARIRRRFALPVVVHFMDDWPNAAYRGRGLAAVERARMKYIVADHVAAAHAALGIGDAMCDAFGTRYGREFLPFQNIVDIDRWQEFLRHDAATAGPPFTLLYAGSIYANAQLDSLVDACHAVRDLNDAGFAVALEIASPEFLVAPWRAVLECHPMIRVVPPIKDDEAFFRRISAVDALLLPVNFDAASGAFIRYSMPTKAPAYMASGTPVLVYGPQGLAQVDYAATAGWGSVLDVRDEVRLAEAIRAIMTQPELRESLRQRAQQTARERHDAAEVRRRFQDVLKSAAQETGE